MAEHELLNGDAKEYGAVNGNAKKKSDEMMLIDSANSKSNGDSTIINFLDKDRYFADGTRRVDYILVYEEKIEDESQPESSLIGQLSGGIAAAVKKKDVDKQRAKWRRKFLLNLKGLEYEEEKANLGDILTTFIKLHAPWETMCYHAEDLAFRVPIQTEVTQEALEGPNSKNWSAKVLKKLHLPNFLAQDVPNVPPDMFTAEFKNSKLERFIGSDNRDTFFKDTLRHTVVFEILDNSRYGNGATQVGIERLINEGGFTGAFPLHAGGWEVPKVFDPDHLNERQALYKYWGRWGMWYKYQPLQLVREYFGEKIGFYFAWLGFYTCWLLPASIVGILVFLYGLATKNFNVPAQEICDSGTSIVMCPLCDTSCKTWYASDVCPYSRLSYLFDNNGTVFMAIFMSLWSVFFLEFWKRKNASLAHHWDVMDFEEEERPRAEFKLKAPEMKPSPITDKMEPYFDPSKRTPRIAYGIVTLIMMIILVLIFITAVIMYRIIIKIAFFKNEDTRAQAGIYASGSAACLNLVIIMILSRIYEGIAVKLTDWELHRTDTEYEDQLTFKVFIFQFVNFYSSIFYIAFIKGKFAGYPGNYNRMFGYRQEECTNGSCLMELAQQLAVIMIGKQVIGNVQEVAIPKIKGWLHRRKRGKLVDEVTSPWKEDYTLLPYEGLFGEYMEMVLQFGFITIFVAAFPLAPLFALLNNWVEIRLDANKLVCETRRPVSERAEDIGVWFTILESLTTIAVISNAFLIAFTSKWLDRQMYEYQFDKGLEGFTNFTLSVSPKQHHGEICMYDGYRDQAGNHTMYYWKLLALRLSFVIVFEHVVFGCTKLIDLMVPDVPLALEVKIKRERFMAKQALSDTGDLKLLIQDEGDSERSGGTSGKNSPREA